MTRELGGRGLNLTTDPEIDEPDDNENAPRKRHRAIGKSESDPSRSPQLYLDDDEAEVLLNRSIAKDSTRKRLLRGLLKDMQNHSAAWPFLQPVNREEAPDYYEVIKEPMDLSTMESMLEHNLYLEPAEFLRDAKLIFDNCRIYNNETTPHVKNANKLERFLWEKIKNMPPEWQVGALTQLFHQFLWLLA